MNIHEETLEIARSLIHKDPSLKDWVVSKFPELKESEDESIRKEIISIVKSYRESCITEGNHRFDDCIAWLEKQGEQKPADKVEPKFKVGDWIVWKDKNYKVNYNGCGYELFDQNGLSTSWDYKTIEDNAHLWTIQDAKDGDVLYSDNDIIMVKAIYNTNNPHFISYCNYSIEYNIFQSWERDCWFAKTFVLATKEQCDLLFSKMKEAGYEWDAEKKELKKIEHDSTELGEEDERIRKEIMSLIEWSKSYSASGITNDKAKKMYIWLKKELKKIEDQPAEPQNEEELSDFEAALFSAFSDAWQQYLHGEEVDMAQWAKEHSAGLLEAAKEKPAEWSKEDKKMYDILCSMVHGTYVVQTQETIDELLSWLKSLKPQPHWKPSEEQMIYLKKVYETYDFCDGERCALESLYNDLKEL